MKDTINLQLLQELNNRKINFPNFADLGEEKMAQFIWANSYTKEISKLRDSKELASERSALELEIWCKEIYSKIQDSFSRCVTSNPTVTISISAALV